ncbi:MAG: hypothetical protein IAG10_22705 [Planctomycetaceae bacterium]|nr:hypothetical protein [Planctomycetaceae bacterium]
MSRQFFRWMARLLFGAMLYPVMQFVVLPMIGAQRFQLSGNETSAWEEVSKQLNGSRVPGSIPRQSDQKAKRPTAERSQGKALKPNEKIMDIGGHQMLISPALKSSNSVRFDTGKSTSSSSANCKPGST